MTPICKILYTIQFLLFNSSVPAQVKIGKKSKFAYNGIGVVLHKNTVIGDNCIIGQGITIGGRGKQRPCNVIIGNNVYIGAGVRILGNVKIGNYVVISPNSIVISDIPDFSIAIGFPAKVTKSISSIDEYYLLT